jgi:hypothetical protein
LTKHSPENYSAIYLEPQQGCRQLLEKVKEEELTNQNQIDKAKIGKEAKRGLLSKAKEDWRRSSSFSIARASAASLDASSSFSLFLSPSSSSFKESTSWRASAAIFIAPSSFEEEDSTSFCSRVLSTSREVYWEAKASREEITAHKSLRDKEK